MLVMTTLVNPASAESPAESAGGVIYLNKKGYQCGLYNLPTYGAMYLGDHPCKNDEVESFELNLVDPGVIIRLGSDSPKNNQCEAGNWTFTLLVYTRLHTPTGDIPLTALQNVPNGQDVRDGVRMLQNDYKKGNIKGKLSCVNAWVDNTRSNH